jgi:glucosamine 6-phosphate synthetase-like amidotransferase/phosphosugar isomerase protein
VALEGIKAKEISYIHAEGYPAAEMSMLIALIDESMPVVMPQNGPL